MTKCGNWSSARHLVFDLDVPMRSRPNKQSTSLAARFARRLGNSEVLMIYSNGVFERSDKESLLVVIGSTLNVLV
jgi:hypothetical protein